MSDTVTVIPPPEYKLAIISPVEATINELVKRYAGVVYDVSTTAGMSTARLDRAALRTARGNLEVARKAEKADVVKLGKFIDSEAARIGAVIEEYEGPLATLIKVEDDRKEAIKVAKEEANRQRIANTIGKIEQIKSVAANVADRTADEITVVIDRLCNLPTAEEDYKEFLPDAIAAVEASINKLRELRAAKVTQEAEAAQAEVDRLAGIEREEADRVERDRLAAIESDRLAAAQRVLDDERAAFEKEKSDAALKKIEDDRIAAEAAQAAQAIIDAEAAEAEKETDRLAAEQQERDRIAAVAAEEERQKAVVKAAEEEKARKLAEAKCDSAMTALKEILEVCTDDSLQDYEALVKIALIAEANYAF